MKIDKKAKILCADDEDRNLLLIEGMLAPLGYEVIVARDGNSFERGRRSGQGPGSGGG
jgi:CheY-like chemotaxis protein